MGWFVWFAETLLCLAAAYVVAAALYPERGVLHRIIGTLIVAPSLILVAMQAAGFAGVLRPVWLGLVAVPVFAVPGWIALRRIGRDHLLALVRSDADSIGRLLRESRDQRDPAILAAMAGALLLAI